MKSIVEGIVYVGAMYIIFSGYACNNIGRRILKNIERNNWL